MRRALVALLLLPLAGCAQPAPSPWAPSATFVGALVAPASPDGSWVSIVALRANGTLDLLLVRLDNGTEARIAEGVTYDAKDLARLLAGRGGTLEGGQTGRVPNATLDAARSAFASWPAPHEGGRMALLRFGADGSVDRVALPPVKHEDLPPLDALFRAARDVRFEGELRAGPLPTMPTVCARTSLDAGPRALAGSGALVHVVAGVTNCDEAPLVLGTPGCDEGPAFSVLLVPAGERVPYTLAPNGTARSLRLLCDARPDPVVVAPGETRRWELAWNGTLADCDLADACALRAAPPGRYTLFASVTYSREGSTPVDVTVLASNATKVPLLVAREWDWLNGTSNATVYGDFGGHCAPASWTEDPASLTVRLFGSQAPPLDFLAAIVRDFRDGPPSSVPTTSADRIGLVTFDYRGVNLTAPFVPNATSLLAVRVEGPDFVVDGARLPPGGTMVKRVEYATHGRNATSILELRNLGPASLAYESSGGCM